MRDVYVQGEGGLMGLVVHPDFAASRVADPMVGGLPLNPSGRHSGCRPTLGRYGTLYVGSGDSARPDVSQDRTQLGSGRPGHRRARPGPLPRCGTRGVELR